MRSLVLSVLLGSAAAVASAANFSGKWTMEMTDRPPGRMARMEVLLNQVGSEVNGSINLPGGLGSGSPTGSEIYGGKAEGDTLTFYVWTGEDKPVKMVFQGTLAGEEIRFTVTGSPVRFDVRGERMEPPGPRQVTARRTK